MGCYKGNHVDRRSIFRGLKTSPRAHVSLGGDVGGLGPVHRQSSDGQRDLRPGPLAGRPTCLLQEPTPLSWEAVAVGGPRMGPRAPGRPLAALLHSSGEPAGPSRK